MTRAEFIAETVTRLAAGALSSRNLGDVRSQIKDYLSIALHIAERLEERGIAPWHEDPSDTGPA